MPALKNDDLRSMTLTPEQEEKLRERKVELRLENEAYIRSHPELRDVTKNFLAEVLRQRPDDVISFAATFFTTAANFESQAI